MLVEVQVLKFAESELALSDAPCLHVYHVIVVWRTINCISTVADADQHKLRWPHLPHGCDCYFDFFHSILSWQTIWELVVVVVLAFFTQIIGPELESITMSAFEPAEHRMVIGFRIRHSYVQTSLLSNTWKGTD